MTHDELLTLAQERWPELDTATVRIIFTERSQLVIPLGGVVAENIIPTGDPPMGHGPESNTLVVKSELE